VNAAFEKRLLVVWLGLSAMSILQWWLGARHGEAVLAASAAITVSVLVMALAKVWFIMREFMEVRHAPPLLRRLVDGYLALTGVALLGIYCFGMAS